MEIDIEIRSRLVILFTSLRYPFPRLLLICESVFHRGRRSERIVLVTRLHSNNDRQEFAVFQKHGPGLGVFFLDWWYSSREREVCDLLIASLCHSPLLPFTKSPGDTSSCR